MLLTTKKTEEDALAEQMESAYDFIAYCKATGKPVVLDYYAVARGLDLSPQVSHSLKKIMASGKRSGGKSYLQDITEARNQLNQELKFIELCAAYKSEDP